MIREKSEEYIKGIFAHPVIYPFVKDDYSPSRENFKPPMNEQIIYLRPESGGACFMFHPHSFIVWEVHSAVLPEYRKHSAEYTRGCVEYLRAHTQCKCLITMIPAGNHQALHLAEATGMRLTGTLANSFMKNGKLIDQKILAMEI